MSWLTLILLALAFGAIQALIGGPKLVYGLPTYVLFGLAGVSTAFAAWKGRLFRPNRLCLWSTLALAGYVCIRSLFSPVNYLARTDRFMVLGAITVYLITVVYLTSSGKRRALLWILFAYALVHVFVGFLQFTKGDNYMLLPWIMRPDYGRRASGFYICPNHIAGLFETLTLLATALACWGRGSTWLKIASGYCAAVCLAGLAITGSRGGYISIVVGSIALVAFSLWVIKKIQPRRFLVYLLIAMAAMSVVLGTGLYLTTRSTDLAKRVDQIYDPTNMRLLLWQAALKQFALQPAFGTGSGTYEFYGRHFRSANVQADPIHVHDDYLELLAEYGAVGELLMAVFLVAHISSGIGALKTLVQTKMQRNKGSNELALIIGCEAAVAALLAHSVMDFNIHIPANTLYVAFLFGILATPMRMTEEGEVREPRSPLWLRLAPAAVGLLQIVTAVPYLLSEYNGERARVALRDGHYSEALAFAQKSLESDQRNPDVFYYLAEAKQSLAFTDDRDTPRAAQDQSEAIEAYQAGLRLFPDDLRLQLRLGRAYDLLNRFDEAETYLGKALVWDPNFSNVYAYYGLHLYAQGRYKKAERFYLKAKSLGETQISPQGLSEIERQRKASAENDVLSQFVTKRDDDEDSDDDEDYKPSPPSKH